MVGSIGITWSSKSYLRLKKWASEINKYSCKADVHLTESTLYKIFWSDWSLSSLDINPLEFYFWNSLKENVYKELFSKPFKTQTENENKVGMDDCASKTEEIKTTFQPFLSRS